MKLMYYEVRDLEKFLGTLASCDELGVAPRLTDDDVFILNIMHAKMDSWLRTFSRGD